MTVQLGQSIAKVHTRPVPDDNFQKKPTPATLPFLIKKKDLTL